MNQVTKLLRRALFFFKRDRFDRDLAEEIQFHLEMKIQQNIDSGMSKDEARYAAMRVFGNSVRTRERSEEIWMFHTLEVLVRDIRYATRMLVKNPAFTFVAVIALALGIGANTAIFSIVNTVLLRPLPYSQPDRLVSLSTDDLSTKAHYSQSYPNFRDLKAESSVFESISVYKTSDFTLTDESDPMHLQGAVVSASLFNLLGTMPRLGRPFLPNEEEPGTTAGIPPVILSNSLWLHRFHGDAGVLGRVITLDNNKYNVVGVMPSSFEFPIQTDTVQLWTTISYLGNSESADDTPMTEQRGFGAFNIVARLKSNLEIRQA